MASPVQAKAVILYALIDGEYKPIACAKDAAITTTADFLEVAARSSTAWREFEYGRLSGKITGTAITKIDTSLGSVYDFADSQFNRLKFLVKFSTEDPSGNYRVFECEVLVEELVLSGNAAELSNFTYSLQITGPILISTTQVVSTPETVVSNLLQNGARALVQDGEDQTILTA